MSDFPNILIALDKKINASLLSSNPCVTISKQTAIGLNQRNNFKYSDEEAMLRAHGNMLISFGGIGGGGLLLKKKLGIGFIFLGIGLLFLVICSKDWSEGKKYIENTKC